MQEGTCLNTTWSNLLTPQLSKVRPGEVLQCLIDNTFVPRLPSTRRDGHPSPIRGFVGCRVSCELCFLGAVREMDWRDARRQGLGWGGTGPIAAVLLSVVLEPAASTSSGNLVDMQILSPSLAY